MAISKNFRTAALKENQHLKISSGNPANNIDQVFCEGYTDGKRDKTLDSIYQRADLKKTAAIAPKKETKEPKAPKITKQQEKIVDAMQEAPVMKASEVPEINLDEIKTALLLKGNLSEGTMVELTGYAAKVKEIQKTGVKVVICLNGVESPNALDTHFINF
jgi:hypothetical protein